MKLRDEGARGGYVCVDEEVLRRGGAHHGSSPSQDVAGQPDWFVHRVSYRCASHWTSQRHGGGGVGGGLGGAGGRGGRRGGIGGEGGVEGGDGGDGGDGGGEGGEGGEGGGDGGGAPGGAMGAVQ